MDVFDLLLVVSVIEQAQRLDDGYHQQDGKDHYSGLRRVGRRPVGQEVLESPEALPVEVLDEPVYPCGLADVGLYLICFWEEFNDSLRQSALCGHLNYLHLVVPSSAINARRLVPCAHRALVHNAIGQGELCLDAQHNERRVVLSGTEGLVQQFREHAVQLNR